MRAAATVAGITLLTGALTGMAALPASAQPSDPGRLHDEPFGEEYHLPVPFEGDAPVPDLDEDGLLPFEENVSPDST